MNRYILTVNEDEFKKLINIASQLVISHARKVIDPDTDELVMEPESKALVEEATAVIEQMNAQDHTTEILSTRITDEQLQDFLHLTGLPDAKPKPDALFMTDEEKKMLGVEEDEDG